MTREMAVAARSTGPARPVRGKSPWPLRFTAALVRAVGQRPGRVLVSVALVGGVGVFSWNALMRQPSRHPAPLFAAAKRAVEPPRRPEAANVPLPVPRPDTGAAPSRPVAEPVRVAAPGDPIAALIRSSDPSTTRPTEPKGGASGRLVTVQRALAKLGYGPIAADGVMGTTTRQAIEKFERDRHLPVTGGTGQRTLRQLAQLSGMQVE